MMYQKDLIHNSDWDILIVLDACRYDVFKKVYKEMLEVGKLTKVKSSACWTFGWFIDTFYKMSPLKDVTLITAIPPVNSENIKIYNRVQRRKYEGIKFNLRDYFKKIVDLTQTKFDKRYGIVFPEKVTDNVISVLSKEKDSRVMCKYFQVHDPYLYHINRGLVKEVDIPTYAKREKVMSRGYFVKELMSFFMSDVTFWKIRRFFNKSPCSGMGNLWVTFGTEGIRKAYEEDMKFVLRDIKRILSVSRGKTIVITSDHGEYLGEEGNFGHGSRRTKDVEEVPWLEIHN